jgi:hypothetical protein
MKLQLHCLTMSCLDPVLAALASRFKVQHHTEGCAPLLDTLPGQLVGCGAADVNLLCLHV